MSRAPSRASALAALAAVIAVVVTGVTIPSVERWWNHHSVIADVVASMLILAVTVLIVDEVAARRGVKERGRVAAVQSVIVYGQALRTERALVSSGEGAEGADVATEVRTLAYMLLTAAPALFDDPAARHFMERAERFSASLLRLGLNRSGPHRHRSRPDEARVRKGRAARRGPADAGAAGERSDNPRGKRDGLIEEKRVGGASAEAIGSERDRLNEGKGAARIRSPGKRRAQRRTASLSEARTR